jgi:hypothetical protein
VDAVLKSNEFLALVGSHRMVWTSRRDRELVQWLLLMSENGLVSGDFLKLRVGDLPLRFEGAPSSPSVDKAYDLLQMFHSIKGVEAREFALRFLTLQELNRAIAAALPLLDLSQVAAAVDAASADNDTVATLGHSVRIPSSAPSAARAYLSCQLAAVRDIVLHDVKSNYFGKLLTATATSGTPVGLCSPCTSPPSRKDLVVEACFCSCFA